MNMNAAGLAAATADLISDRLREMLLENEDDLNVVDEQFDTTLATRSDDGFEVYLVELQEGHFQHLNDARKLVRITVEEVR